MTQHIVPTDASWKEVRSRLFQFVNKRVASREEAEDIVHDVLVRAYTRRDTLREATRWQAWLYQITRNAIIDHYRSSRTMEMLPDTLVAEEAEPSGASELAHCVEPLLKQLSLRYREPVTLTDLEGKTQTSVAKELGLSVSGAKSRVQRGRQMLKSLLLRCCQLEWDAQGHILDATPQDTCTTCGCQERAYDINSNSKGE